MRYQNKILVLLAIVFLLFSGIGLIVPNANAYHSSIRSQKGHESTIDVDTAPVIAEVPVQSTIGSYKTSGCTTNQAQTEYTVQDAVGINLYQPTSCFALNIGIVTAFDTIVVRDMQTASPDIVILPPIREFNFFASVQSNPGNDVPYVMVLSVVQYLRMFLLVLFVFSVTTLVQGYISNRHVFSLVQLGVFRC